MTACIAAERKPLQENQQVSIDEVQDVVHWASLRPSI